MLAVWYVRRARSAVEVSPQAGIYHSVPGVTENPERSCGRNPSSGEVASEAHGNPALAAHLRGELSLADAADIGKRDTRRYAKRQFTWIAGQLPNWPRVAAPDLQSRVDAALAS